MGKKQNNISNRPDDNERLQKMAGRIERLERELEESRNELKKSEAGLLLSEGLYRHLFESMISGFALCESVFDENDEFCSYKFLDINPAFEKITGLKRKNVIGKDVQEVFPGTEREWINLNGRVAVTGKPDSFEMYHSPTDKFYLSSVFRPYPTKDKFCITFIDTSKRNKAEQEIKKLALFPSENPDPVMRVSQEGTIIYANKSSDIILKTLGCEVGDKLSDILLEKTKIALRGGSHEDFEIECEESFFSIRFAPVVNEGYVNLYGLDITNRKKAEEERHRLQLELDHTKRLEAIGQLAGGIAHDFNNILTYIQGNAELLHDMFDAQHKGVDLVERILHGSNRAAELTRQLLGFARKGKLQTTSVNVHSTLNDAIMLLGRSVDKNIEVRTELQADRHVVMGDPSQLENAFLNLGLNARDAMDNGGILAFSTRNICLDEKLHARRSDEIAVGDYLEICVSDTGHGIDNELQAKIFEPFFTTKPIGKGTGLGLSSVYGCVKSHQGSILVYSEPEKGTVFKIYLPLLKETNASEKDFPQAAQAGKGHVLVIDDEEKIRHFTAAALSKIGYTSTQCSGGQEGVNYFKEHTEDFDYIILDLIMPKMSGVATFDELRKIDSDIKILVVTGFIQNGRTESILKNEGVGFLSKPFSIEELSQQLAIL